MFNKTIRDIEKTQEHLNYQTSTIKHIKRLVEELERQIKTAQQRYKYKITDTRRPILVIKKLIENAKKRAVSVLIKHFDLATQTNVEFSNQVYRNLMYTAILGNESIFMFIPRGSGWGTQVGVQIVLEKVGTINDYSRGILLYREKLHVKEGKKEGSGRRATEYWLTKIYGDSLKLAETVLKRVSMSGRPAPFWQLVNSGSPAGGLPSDRSDDSYNPFPSEPTGFVDDAERELRVELSQQIQENAIIVAEEALLLKNEIDNAVNILNETRRLLADIGMNIAKARQVTQKLGKPSKYIDQNKLVDAIRKSRSGQEFDTATIDISRAGSGKRTRLTVRRLEGLID